MDTEPRQTISVETAESWMDRSIKVSLTMQITPKNSNAQVIYLDADEALSLIRQLTEWVGTHS